MLGSAIPRRWVVSLALVGLVSLFMASYTAVWSDPASAATTGGTVPGQILTDIEASGNMSMTTSAVTVIQVIPKDDDGNDDYGMADIVYSWNAGSCGSFASSTTTVPENTFTASASACSAGTIVVHGNQRSGADVPSGGRSITVNVSAPATAVPTVALTAADDGAVIYTDAELAVFFGDSNNHAFSDEAQAAGVVPSKSTSVTNDDGNSISISAGSLDSGDSKIVVVDKVVLADLQAPPPAAKSGSTSGTFRFGSSAIQINFLDGNANGIAGKTTLNKPAQVCMPYTKADSDGAYKGVDGLKIWHYNGTEWVSLKTTVLGSPSRVCAYTSSFSPFALGLDVAPPETAGGETGLPATGGYSPNSMTLLLAMFAGFALVGTGVVAARRARRAGVNS